MRINKDDDYYNISKHLIHSHVLHHQQKYHSLWGSSFPSGKVDVAPLLAPLKPITIVATDRLRFYDDSN